MTKKSGGTRYHQWNDSRHVLNKDLLSRDPFRDFTFEFTGEEKRNIESLEITQNLEDSVLFDFKNSCLKYPMIFLSCLPQEPVFVWKTVLLGCQLNRKDANSSHNESERGIFASLTVFAKINILSCERLLEAKFLGSNWVYTKTKQGEKQLSVRVYSTDGYLKIRENFWNTRHLHSVSAMSLALLELDVQNFKNITGAFYFKVNLSNSTRDNENNQIFEGTHKIQLMSSEV